MRFFHIALALSLVGLAAVTAALSPSESGDGLAIHGVVFPSTSQSPFIVDRFNSTSPLLVDSDSSLQLMHHSGVSQFDILETRLPKRAPTITTPVIKGAVYYREKQHTIQAESNCVFDGEQARKWSENGHKAEAVISNLPIKSQQVVNDYEGKIKLAQRMIRSGLGNQKIRGDNSMTWNEKHQDWVDKKPHWEHRTSQLEEHMAEKQEAGTFVLKDPKAEAQVSAYNTRRLERSRNPWQHVHATIDKRLAKRGLVPFSQAKDASQPKKSDSFEANLHKRGDIKHAVDYYKKADEKKIGSDEWKHNMVKAKGAMYNDPLYSEIAVKNYDAKISKADEQLQHGKGTDPVNARLLRQKKASWTQKQDDWKSRRDNLIDKNRSAHLPLVDNDVLERVLQYQAVRQPRPNSLPDSKEPVIRHPLHYRYKADMHLNGRKWGENNKKYLGARYKEPEASQDVVNLYKSKIDVAKAKVDSIQDPMEKFTLKDKISKWKKSVPLWQAQRDELGFQKDLKRLRAEPFTDVDPDVEKAIHEYENPPKRSQDELSMKLNRKLGGQRRLVKRALVPEVMHVLENTSSKISKVITSHVGPHHPDSSKHRLQKRAEPSIRTPTEYLRKVDKYVDMFHNGGHDEKIKAKVVHNSGKGNALLFKDPAMTSNVLKRYGDKIQSTTEQLKQAHQSSPWLVDPLNDKISTYRKKNSEWEDRQLELQMAKLHDLRSGSLKPMQMDEKVKEERDKFNAIEYGNHEPYTSIHRRPSVIHDAVHYYQKADGQEIDSQKWSDNLIKAHGARYKHPKYSQWVIDNYKTKKAQVYKQMRDGRKDMMDKIVSYDSKIEDWKRRRDELQKEMWHKQKAGTFSVTDDAVEGKIKEYQKNWKARPFEVPDPKYDLPRSNTVASSPRGHVLLKRSLVSDRDDDSLLQKRAGAGIRPAVDYVRKGDHYEERYKASGGNKVLFEKKKQNREKGYALRTNDPKKTATVIARYNKKLASASGGSGRPASGAKMERYKEKKSHFEERHAMLLKNQKEQMQAGNFRYVDPQVKEEVAKYHREEYRPHMERKKWIEERNPNQLDASNHELPGKKSKTAAEDMMDIDFVPRNVNPRLQESQVHNHIPKISDGATGLKKRVTPALRSAVEYVRKETKYEEALKHSPNNVLLKDKQEQNHEKQQALRSRNPGRTVKVIKRLDGKIERTSNAMQQAGRSDPELIKDLNEKLASYKGKKQLWQAHHAALVEDKARTGKKFVNDKHPEVEKEVHNYYKNEHPYRKLALQPIDTDRKSHDTIHSAVHYYKKAIGNKSNDVKRKAAIRKAEGARYKHPEYSQTVIDHYGAKISNAMYDRGSSVARPDIHDHDKYLSWWDKKGDWTQRRDDLARDMIQAIDRGETFSKYDAKVEEQLKTELPKHLRKVGQVKHSADSSDPSKEISGQKKDVSEGLRKRLQKRTITPEVKIGENVEMEVPYVIKDAVHYYNKADRYPEGSVKRLEHRLKAAGARFRNPLASRDVVRLYDRKSKAAEKQLNDGEGDGKELKAKVKEWRDKMIPAWQARKALMEEHKVQNANKDPLWYKDLEVELRYKAYEVEKAARQAAARTGEASTSEKQVEKRGAIMSPVEYYRKADGHEIDSQKWHHDLLKATGARYNDPSYSNDVVRSYNGKMEGLRKQLKSMKGGTPESAAVVKKMLSHDAKIGNWEQRRDKLRKEKAAKELMGTYTIRDEETEKKVEEYQRNWRAKPFTFPDHKYDLPKQGGKSVIKSVPEYFLKGKQLRDSRFRDSWIDKESERKYREIIKKAAGARYNDPEFSQRVIDMYKSKLDDAQKKIREGKEDAEALKHKVPLWEHTKLPEWKYRHDMLELQKAEQDSKGLFKSFNPDVEKTISEYHANLRKAANQPHLPAAQPFTKRGMVDERHFQGELTQHLEKRGVIRDPVHYYQKGDGQEIDSPKWHHSQMKAKGARYNEPSFSQEVVHSYAGKLGKERKHLNQVKAGGPEWNASMWKVLSYDGKMNDWEQRRSALRQAKVAKERIGSYSVKDKEIERKVEEYQKTWRSQPFTFPDPKYDLPTKEAAHDNPQSNASPGKKRSAIKTVPQYWQKTKKHVMEGMDGGKWVNPESERKHSEAMMKGNGARFNDPKSSQRVVDLYEDKITVAEEKMRRKDKDTEVLKKKVTAWKNTNLPEWERRLKWLKFQKGVQDRSGTFQSFDSVVEKTISDYLAEEKKRTAQSRLPASQHPHVETSTHLTKRGVDEVADAQGSSRDGKQDEPQLQKRTIDAVRFMKKGDQIAKRPANTGMERAKKNKKWMENLIKTQGARYNTPADSARVVDLYEGKLTQARKKVQWISRAQGDTEELEVKMRKWDQETIPSWQHRRARLASEMHSKLSTGQFQARDPKTELAIERYEDAKRAQRLKRKRIQKKKLRVAAAARSQDRHQDQGAGPSKKAKVEPKDEP